MATKDNMKTIKIPNGLWKTLSKLAIDKEVPIYKIIEGLVDEKKPS